MLTDGPCATLAASAHITQNSYTHLALGVFAKELDTKANALWILYGWQQNFTECMYSGTDLLQHRFAIKLPRTDTRRWKCIALHAFQVVGYTL